MNYYAQGGQAHGIKSIAHDLVKYGRNGDTMLAHINPEEAAVLKAMGGSGTINPHTGLPEYGLGSIFKGGINAVKSVVQPVYNATLKNIPGVDQALVGVDKAVGKTIPGGWGTLGMVAASMVPGMTPMMMAGLGALNGSGVMRGDGKFNLQGALMGGAAAYGMANLTSGLEAAGGGSSSIPAGDIVTANASVDPIGALNASQNFTGAAAQEAAANAAVQGAGSSAANAVNPDVYSGLAGTQGAITPPPTPSGLENLATGYGQNASAVGEGLKNLTGFGADGSAAAARAAFTGSGATLQNTALPIAMGSMGLMDIKAQEDYLNAQKASGAINDSDYNSQMTRINEAKSRASAAMDANPYQFAEGGEVKGYFGGGVMQAISARIQNDPSFLDKVQSSSGGSGFLGGIPISAINQMAGNSPALDYKQLAAKAMAENPYKYAMGGAVNPRDDQSNMPSQTPMQRFEPSGMMNYAEGGMAGGRFLSGGGDGLSDDIPAIIGDKQPAKLADGEFVVSSDVVSGLGGGSSKAGAKKLYSMMDRVRKQAHGTKKQIRPVNTKALPA